MSDIQFDQREVENRSFRAGAAVAEMPVIAATFERWTGAALSGVSGSVANKPLCAVAGKPAFAELALVATLAARGRHAVWLDVYHRRARFSMVRTMKLGEFIAVGTGDAAADEVLRRLIAAKAGKLGGLWDVFTWGAVRLAFSN